MMQEESGDATHDSGMAHDHDDGRSSSHNMMLDVEGGRGFGAEGFLALGLATG